MLTQHEFFFSYLTKFNESWGGAHCLIYLNLVFNCSIHTHTHKLDETENSLAKLNKKERTQSKSNEQCKKGHCN